MGARNTLSTWKKQSPFVILKNKFYQLLTRNVDYLLQNPKEYRKAVFYHTNAVKYYLTLCVDSRQILALPIFKT